MDPKKVEAFIRENVWFQHSEGDCDGTEAWRLIDLPVAKLDAAEREEAIRFIQERTGIQYGIKVDFSDSMGRIEVLRIRFNENVARFQVGFPDVRIVEHVRRVTAEAATASVNESLRPDVLRDYLFNPRRLKRQP